MALGDPVLSLGLVGLLLCESPPLEVQLILIHVLRIRWLVFLDRVLDPVIHNRLSIKIDVAPNLLNRLNTPLIKGLNRDPQACSHVGFFQPARRRAILV
ncbi:hypothetical protein D3C79_354510 [compost metagenome]